MRKGTLMDKDFRACNSQMEARMGPSKWKKLGSKDKATHFFNNKDVAAHNIHSMKQLQLNGHKVVRISAMHSGRYAKNGDDSQNMNIPRTLYLCVGAKVTIPTNLCIQYGLVNGSTGVVKDIVFDHKKLPNLSKSDSDFIINPPSWTRE